MLSAPSLNLIKAKEEKWHFVQTEHPENDINGWK